MKPYCHCHTIRHIGYHGEPLFAYNSISNEYHLLGLSSGAVKQDVKFIDNFKSVWHYLPWISETVRNSVAQREELNRIWMAEENKDMEYGWLWKYLKKNL
uniref:Uncharacterized protein n=1 Tax=Romanomermis culicivorax TaxID=13658 RepID=A0A915I5Z6_ROMCU